MLDYLQFTNKINKKLNEYQQRIINIKKKLVITGTRKLKKSNK